MTEREKTTSVLADMLEQAETAHAASGHSADGWAKWYAAWLMANAEFKIHTLTECPSV